MSWCWLLVWPRTATQTAYNGLAEAYAALADDGRARHWRRMALDVQPDDVASHLTHARLLAKNVTTSFFFFFFFFSFFFFWFLFFRHRSLSSRNVFFLLEDVTTTIDHQGSP